MRTYQLRDFASVSTLKESTHLGEQTQELRNVILRPAGGFKGPLIYNRLLEIPTFSSLKTTLYGSLPTSTLKTSAVKILSQGKCWLIFYDWINNKCRGFFYLGDDGSFTGTLNLISGSVSYQPQHFGMNDTARWYGQRVYDQILLGNGVDNNLIAQLDRQQPADPHRELRYMGSNAVPSTPIVETVPIATVANVQATWVIDGSGEAPRSSGVVLTFTADPQQFAGAAGNNIRIQIIFDFYSPSLNITRSGDGTLSSPYIFVINTAPGGANSSNNAIVAAVAASTLCFGVFSAATATFEDNEDTGSWGDTALSGGVDANESVGFFDTIKSIYLRYWDPGENDCGYEGPSSAKSADIIIGDTTGDERDIRVQVTGNTGVEGGRFTFIRIYLQFGVGDEAVWNLVREVPNTNVATQYTIGTDTTIGQAMSVDQGRPLPSRFFTFAAQKTWQAGILQYPSRVAISKAALEDELVPEGVNQESFISVPGQLDESGRSEIRALVSDETWIHCHTTRGITLVSPSDFARFNAPVQAGAMNQNMIAQWERGKSYYLSLSLMLYSFNGARYSRRDAELKSGDASAYIRDRVSEALINANPDRAWMMADPQTQHLWFWLPDDDGTLRAYAYDFILNGVTGPHDFPKIYASANLESNYTEVCCSDEEGNLLVINPAGQLDHGDALPVQAAFTAHSLASSPPAEDNGWGTVSFSGSKYFRAFDCRIQSGMIDLGSSTTKKAFRAISWRSVPNSRALVEITLTTLMGQTITRYYGDLGSFSQARPHKLCFALNDSAIRIQLRAISAENKSFIIRDVALHYEVLGEV